MFMAGAAEPQWLPRPFARAWRYVSALKVVAWDEQYFSGWLEHVSGVPILSASSGALFVLFGYARREAPESGDAGNSHQGAGRPGWRARRGLSYLPRGPLGDAWDLYSTSGHPGDARRLNS
ncbi:unnamed protein product [Prorocentrum cordatum]|uniref:Uncharacterized protein n=1 Tax=Prorocentrum cordatum TaxID=2364126 RepID=A0ABN9U9K7_9DINO|nr:unnamed protein product [Polarella glacialis]